MAKRQRTKGTGSLIRRTEGGPLIARWTDHRGMKAERSTRTTDRRSADQLLRHWMAETAKRASGMIDPEVEAVTKRAREPIDQTLDAWEASLSARNITPKRIKDLRHRAQAIVIHCKYTSLASIRAESVNAWVAERRDANDASRTINGYLQALGQMVKWAIADGRLASSPLAGVGLVRVIGQTFQRRPLDPVEIGTLLHTTEVGPVRRGVGGPDRAMLYRLALGTGFRVSELASLTPACFDLNADPPAVTVRAAYSKRRRDDRQPVRPDLAEALAVWLKSRPAGNPVFDLGDRSRLAGDLRADLRLSRARWITAASGPAERRERARTDFLRQVDRDGRRVDFHALRASYITMLVKSGASVKEAQELARHSDPKLTLGVYTRLGVHDLSGALDRMPTTDRADTPPARETQRATGTTDAVSFVKKPHPIPHPFQRKSAQTDATVRDEKQTLRMTVGDSKPSKDADLRDAVQRDAGESNNTPGRARTCDLCFRKARVKSVSAGNTETYSEGVSNLTQYLTPSASDAPDLARLVEAWPMVPEALRAGILLMVEAAARAGGHG